MTTRFSFHPTAIAGVTAIERKRLSDTRGYFERMYCSEELAAAGWVGPILQINHTFTARQGAVRGMHFQHPPHCEMKVVSCTRGAVIDVAVDLRAGSPTFLKWHAEELTTDNCRSLLIPEGCAHGYQCLTDDVELIYLHNAMYAAQAEGGVHPTEPRVGISWPLPVIDLSAKDASRALLAADFLGIHP